LHAAAPQQAATPAAAPPPAAKGGYRVQLGALRSEGAAKEEWARLKQRHGDLLGGLGAAMSRTEIPEKGTFWRIQAGPIADASKAEHVCADLKKRGVGCILVRP
jgi:cell division septation protein DedD